jgi:hypothetical protein
MKKFFSFAVILLLGAGLFGLPAIPLHPGGDAPGLIMAEADIPEVKPAASTEAVFLSDGQVSYLPGNEAFYGKSARLICGWFEQYQAGLLSPEEFMTLINGRITVMYMRGQAIEDIQRITSLAPAKYPLRC